MPVNDTNINRMGFFILSESMHNNIGSHFLEEKPGKIPPPAINSMRSTEIDHLLGNIHHFGKIPDADIDAVFFADAEIIRDHHEFFHIPGKLPANDPGISDDRDHTDNAIKNISDINAIHQ